jgi:2-polyprenyl-3-methyl-5-hydroxy-6-metoxy-1,4-benzoquinol methylase
MVTRVEQKENEIWEIERVRKYAKGHKKYTWLMYRGIIKEVRNLKLDGRFLEVGAGPGFLAVIMAQDNPRVNITAIDLSPDMAEVAQEYIREKKLDDRIRYVVGNVGDKELLGELGKFDLVYSTFSLHHWEKPEESIQNLWNAVADSGLLYIYDFKRIDWLCNLPIEEGAIDSMKAALKGGEIKDILQRIGITSYKIKNNFPLFQSIIVRK